jgi:tetratricopeptide (TPR) repeat protein
MGNKSSSWSSRGKTPQSTALAGGDSSKTVSQSSPSSSVENNSAAPVQLPPFCTLGIRFTKLDVIIDMLGGRAALQGKTTDEVCRQHLMPLTMESKLSLCEQLDAFNDQVRIERQNIVGEANWFISHAWSYQFLDVMEAVTIFMEKEYRDAGSREYAVIWFDMFSNSQHSTQNRPFEWWKGTFMNAVKKLGNVLMILQPWDSPITLTRAWCIIELLACELTKSRFAVSMSRAETERFNAMFTEDGVVHAFHKMLSQINSCRSEARSVLDRQQIHDAVRQLVSGGFGALDSMVLRVFETWMVDNLRADIALSLALDEVEKLEQTIQSQENNLEEAILFQVNTLASLYKVQGRYDVAEPLFERCLESRKQLLGAEHPLTMQSSNNLASVYHDMGKYDAAESLFQECLEARSRVCGEDHPDTLTCASNLALLYKDQGKYEAGEQLLQRCVETQSRLSGPDHADTLIFINNLAALYAAQGNYDAAEPLYQRCVENQSKLLGIDHTDTLTNLNNLGMLYKAQGRYEEAEQLYRQCAEGQLRVRGPEHPHTIQSINNLASLFCAQGKYHDAEPLLQQCLESYGRVCLHCSLTSTLTCLLLHIKITLSSLYTLDPFDHLLPLPKYPACSPPS